MYDQMSFKFKFTFCVSHYHSRCHIIIFYFFTVFLNVSYSIRVDVNEEVENITETITTTTATAVDLIDESNVTLLADDSELSASERTRRLIPYMAFYLPVSELTINKQYASLPSQAVRL